MVWRRWTEDAAAPVVGVLGNVLPIFIPPAISATIDWKILKRDDVWPHGVILVASWLFALVIAGYRVSRDQRKEVLQWQKEYTDEYNRNQKPELRLSVDRTTFRMCPGFISTSSDAEEKGRTSYDILFACKLVIVNHRPTDVTIASIDLSCGGADLSVRHCFLHPPPFHKMQYRRGLSVEADMLFGLVYKCCPKKDHDIDLSSLSVAIVDALGGRHTCRMSPPNIRLTKDLGLTIELPGVLVTASLPCQYEYRPLSGVI